MPEFTFLDETIHYDEADIISVDRCDFMPIKVGSVKRTDGGYLKGDAPVARVGVLKYLLPDGTIRSEFVPPETLFNKDSMDTLKMQPVTDSHPQEVLLDSTTVKHRKVGMTGETVYQNDNFLVTSMAITDSDAINNVENGKQQLSPGYKCLLVKKDGVYNGEAYNAVQVKRIYNHVAICDRARGGSSLRLNLDSFSAEELETKLDGFEIPQKQEGVHMPKYRVDGIDYEAAQEVINFISKLQGNIDSLTTTNKELSTKVEVAQANVDSLKDKVTTLEKRDIAKEITEGVSRRLSLVKSASAILDKEVLAKIDSMSDMDIKKSIILAKSPEAKLEGKSDIYIDARVDSIVESIDFDADAIDKQRKASGNRHDGSTDPVEKARKDSEDRIKNAYLELK